MVERDFVDALIASIRGFYGYLPNGIVIQRSSDRYTLGIPDILTWSELGTMAIEAKQLSPLMADVGHRGRRTGLMLKHPFMGPQISMLRNFKGVGVAAFGIVRASADTAFRIEPEDLPAKTGNFTYDELIKIGQPVYRKDGQWQLWETTNEKISSPGH